METSASLKLTKFTDFLFLLVIKWAHFSEFLWNFRNLLYEKISVFEKKNPIFSDFVNKMTSIQQIAEKFWE